MVQGDRKFGDMLIWEGQMGPSGRVGVCLFVQTVAVAVVAVASNASSAVLCCIGSRHRFGQGGHIGGRSAGHLSRNCRAARTPS
jgi:hypothetical protein